MCMYIIWVSLAYCVKCLMSLIKYFVYFNMFINRVKKTKGVATSSESSNDIISVSSTINLPCNHGTCKNQLGG